jgi:urease accessory protein
MSSIRVLVPLVAYALSSLAFAHAGHGQDAGIVGGIAHPFVGMDHLLAAIAVGLFAAAQSGAGRWLAPAAFLGGMCGGIVLGRVLGLPPVLEIGIAGSVLAVGVMILVAKRIPDPAALAVFGLFGILHGAAHGAEAAADLAGGAFALYAVGLVVGTGILHAIGAGGGAALRTYALRLWPAVGAAFAMAGVWLLAA